MVNSKGGYLINEDRDIDEEALRKQKERERQRQKQNMDPRMSSGFQSLYAVRGH